MLFRTAALFLLGIGIFSGCGKVERRLRLVTLTELTGPRASYGDGIQKAAALFLEGQRAVLDSNGWQVELTAYDAYASAQDFSSTTSRIAAQQDVACVLVHTDTLGNFSAFQVFHSAGIPAVFPAETASLPATFSSRETVWLSPDDRIHGFADAEWTAANEYTDVFLMVDSGDHPQTIGESYQSRAEALGVNVARFPTPLDQSPSTWIPSFQSFSPQLVYYTGSSAFPRSILEDLEGAGFHGSFLFAESEAEDRIPNNFSSQSISLYYSPATADSEGFTGPESFAEKYETAYGTVPPALAALGYDAAAACLFPLMNGNASDSNPPSPRSVICSAWHAGGMWEGISGTFPLDGGRSCRRWIYTLTKEPDGIWSPALIPSPPASAYPGC